MNRAFKVIWNENTATFVAVPETAKSAGQQVKIEVGQSSFDLGRSAHLFFIKPLIAALICIGFTFASYAGPLAGGLSAGLAAPSSTQLPTGAQVSAGAAQVSQSAAVLTVKQSSATAALNWQTFDVGSQATVNFEQPNSVHQSM